MTAACDFFGCTSTSSLLKTLSGGLRCHEHMKLHRIWHPEDVITRIPNAPPPEIPDSDDGYVYVMETNDLEIKVGWSHDPLARLPQVRVHNPHDPRLLAVVPGSMALERRVHRALGKHQIHGEWFRATPEAFRIIHEHFSKATEKRRESSAPV